MSQQSQQSQLSRAAVSNDRKFYDKLEQHVHELRWDTALQKCKYGRYVPLLSVCVEALRQIQEAGDAAVATSTGTVTCSGTEAYFEFLVREYDLLQAMSVPFDHPYSHIMNWLHSALQSACEQLYLRKAFVSCRRAVRIQECDGGILMRKTYSTFCRAEEAGVEKLSQDTVTTIGRQ
tara:strand:+ start:256 stop:786 length:531 start_codon:yes stop_codon:yes gene_type:complete